MDIDEIDLDVSHSFESDADEKEIRNPEKNFVSTNHRLKFGSDSSSESEKNVEQREHEEREDKITKYTKINQKIRKKSPKITKRSQESKTKSPEREERSPVRIEKSLERLKKSSERTEKSPHKEVDKASNVANEFWDRRRDERKQLAKRGVRRVWGHSPSHIELEFVYVEQERNENKINSSTNGTQKNKDLEKLKKKKHDKKRDVSVSSMSSLESGSDEAKQKKRKDSKKNKKMKKHHSSKSEKKKSKKLKKSHRKRVHSSETSESDSVLPDNDSPMNRQNAKKSIKKNNEDSKSAKKQKKSNDGEDEWIELTRELREEEAERTKQEEALIIGPQIPAHLLKSNSPVFDGKLDSRDRKNMLKGEAAAMAAYAAQGKRIPRRGEIGLSSGEISEFEKVGYVMSGTRHKSMEATRLRKEDQILTAEEKRLLSNFSLEERRGREEAVLNQFRELIASKKSKS